MGMTREGQGKQRKRYAGPKAVVAAVAAALQERDLVALDKLYIQLNTDQRLEANGTISMGKRAMEAAGRGEADNETTRGDRETIRGRKKERGGEEGGGRRRRKRRKKKKGPGNGRNGGKGSAERRK